jgi:seryl-tRNA synthetase
MNDSFLISVFLFFRALFMLDIQRLRYHFNEVAQELAKRSYVLDKIFFNDREARRKDLQVRLEDLQAKRNQLSKEIGHAKRQGLDAPELMAEVAQIAESLQSTQAAFDQVQQELNTWLSTIPNTPDASVPYGTDEQDNEVVFVWGEPSQNLVENCQDHVDLGVPLGLDFEAGALLSGSRFTVMHGAMARLHRAIAQWMLDVHTQEHGYCETYVPYMVNAEALYGTGQLPKFEEDLFRIQREEGMSQYLIPTAEVPLTNLVQGQILKVQDLPIKRVAHTPCFRAEAGSYGRDVRGLIRQHQFDKVELVQIVEPQHSMEALEQLVGHAERMLQLLELPYRKVLLCGGDMGFGACKTYDLEVWLPAQNTYREISSCSNMGAFQARRMKSRYKNTQGVTDFVHTLNGSGLAIGRTLVAILENYQQKDGHIAIPKVLQNYMGGLDIL